MEKTATATAMVTMVMVVVGSVMKQSAMAEYVDEPGIMSVDLRIQNDLGGGIMLHTHCRSRDDDIGNHEFPNSRYTQWSFNNSWLGDTLYWCSMKWNNVEGSFDVYDFKRDLARCVYCWWSIRQDGAYCRRLTPDNTSFTWQLLYRWKKPST